MKVLIFILLIATTGWAGEASKKAPGQTTASLPELTYDVSEHFSDIDSADLGGLLARIGDTRLVLFWAHNSHIGDARATEMHARGEFNLGQQVREVFGDKRLPDRFRYRPWYSGCCLRMGRSDESLAATACS